MGEKSSLWKGAAPDSRFVVCCVGGVAVGVGGFIGTVGRP